MAAISQRVVFHLPAFFLYVFELLFEQLFRFPRPVFPAHRD